MIVVDASVAVQALLADGQARRRLTQPDEAMSAPSLIDCQVASALRRLTFAGAIESDVARSALDAWAKFWCERWNVSSLLGRIWDLRHTMTPYGAAYAALAEAIEGRLITLDARLAAAAIDICAVELLTAE